MRPAILVLNAGSSSVKFLLYAEQDGALEPVVRGQVEGIRSAPHFIARDSAGQVRGRRRPPRGGSAAIVGSRPLPAFLSARPHRSSRNRGSGRDR